MNDLIVNTNFTNYDYSFITTNDSFKVIFMKKIFGPIMNYFTKYGISGFWVLAILALLLVILDINMIIKKKSKFNFMSVIFIISAIILFIIALVDQLYHIISI